MDPKILLQKTIAVLVLHSVGDTIGFKNGDWEFKYDKKIITLDTTLELLYEFIDLGGINDIDLTGWLASDDTIMHIAIATGLIENDKPDANMVNDIKKLFASAFLHMKDGHQQGKKRYIGLKTYNSITKYTEEFDERIAKYDPMSGGNGCAMRTPCIGCVLFGEKNRDDLIYLSIESSRLTHNSPIGYLGGMVGALFTAFAFEQKSIDTWPMLLMEILESDKIKKFLRSEYPNEANDYDEFVKQWKHYIELRFKDDTKIISKAQKNLIFRSRFYYDHFTKNTAGKMIGDSGYSSVIMAYDCLLDAGNKWEKLVIYSAIHWGDTDTVAAIACAWYGALYGMDNVPVNNVNKLEFKDKLLELGEKLFKKYSK